MPAETMTPRERWLAVLNHETPDRIPMDYWATGEASAKLIAHLGCADLGQALRRLHVDTPVNVGPKYVGPPVPEGQDLHGCRYRHVQDQRGAATARCVEHPLATYNSVEEIERNYTWPDRPTGSTTASSRPDPGAGGCIRSAVAVRSRS